MPENTGHGIDLVLSEIRIVHGLDANGNDVYSTMFLKSGTDTDLIDFIEGLGMLEAAKHDFLERHGGCNASVRSDGESNDDD